MHALAAERWLKYWVLFGVTVAAEQLVGRQLGGALPWGPHLKLAWLLWLQSNGGHVSRPHLSSSSHLVLHT